MPFDWSTINTLLLVGAIGYIHRQSRVVDTLKQALLGVEGKGGALEEIKILRQRTHDLANTMTTLSLAVEANTKAIEDRSRRRGG